MSTDSPLMTKLWSEPHHLEIGHNNQIWILIIFGSRADIIGLVVKSLISHWKINGFGTEIKSEVSLCLKLSKILANKVEKKLKSSEHSNRLFDTEWISLKQAEFSQPFDLAKGPATPVKDSLQKVSQLMFLKFYIRFLFTKISITNFRNQDYLLR